MSRSDGFEAELVSALRSTAPLLIITTHEEDRARHALVSAGLDLGYSLIDLEAGGGSPTDDFEVSVLLRATSPALGFLRDGHLHAHSSRWLRSVRDALGALRARGHSLVWTQPAAEVPLELRRDAWLIPMPTPGPRALAAIVEGQLPALDERSVWALAQSAMGLTAHELSDLVSSAHDASPEGVVALRRAIRQRKERSLRRLAGLEPVPTDSGLGQVGGLHALKSWVRRRGIALGPAAKAAGLPPPKGVLLIGVQGCGKSLAAKAVAREWGLPLLLLDLAPVFGGGDADSRLRSALAAAEELAPVALWVDELDKFFSGLSGAGASATTRAFGTLVTWMAERRVPVPVVATANSVEALPPELLRKGRFDEVFFVDLPQARERREILKIHLESRGFAPDAFDLNELADATPHYSGAELEQIVVEAQFEAAASGRAVEQVDLDTAAAESVPLALTFEENIKSLREWARGRARPASTDASLLDLFERSTEP